MRKMMESIKGLPDIFVGVISGGTVTGEDYSRVLIPAIQDKLKKYKKIRLFFQADNDSHI
jgi:predicted alternative tryptophan synthase beta-subunit